MKKKSKNLNFTQVGENINALMEHCEIDATELARETGLPTSTISRLRSSAVDISPNISSLIPIARYFQITVSQLIGEEPLPQDICGTFKPSMVKKQFLPLLVSEDVEEYVTHAKVTTHSFLEVDIAVSAKAFAYIMLGSALEPILPDQTLLIVDPLVTASNQDYVLVNYVEGNTLLVRQLFTENKEYYLRTLNPIFNEFIKIHPDTHQIIGVIVQARQNFKKVEHYLFSNE